MSHSLRGVTLGASGLLLCLGLIACGPTPTPTKTVPETPPPVKSEVAVPHTVTESINAPAEAPSTTPAPEALPKDDAEGMLRRLLESNDPAHANTRYLLAVMLERKRILRPQPSEDTSLLVYEHAKTGETFLVTDPRLSLADLAAVQEEVSTLLAGLSAPPASETETHSGEPQQERPSDPISEEEAVTEGRA